MGKIRTRVFAFAMLFVFALLAGVSGMAEAAPQFMTFAAPPATSNYYPYWVAVGKVVQSAHPEYRVSVSESQGAVDIMNKVRGGMMPLGNSQSSTDYESYYGRGVYDGKAFQDVRLMWYYDESPIQFIVTTDSGVKKMADLDGKKFNPGGTGTSVAIASQQILDVLGVKPDWFNAGQASAADAVSNRQIVGTVKSGNASGQDSYVLQIHASTPVDLVSLSDEEMKAISTSYPYLLPHTIPSGTYDWIQHDTLCTKIGMGAVTTVKLSQEDGYKIVSAIMSDEGRKVLNAAFPNGEKQDVVQLTLGSTIPLHAGTVQYLKEKGIDVPAALIPAEYKE